MLKGFFDILNVDVVVGKINDFAFIFMFSGAINSRNCLNGAKGASQFGTE
jgi:hypothetical protein